VIAFRRQWLPRRSIFYASAPAEPGGGIGGADKSIKVESA
jgi:hypothetical protein